jgi:hypothetical protein
MIELNAWFPLAVSWIHRCLSVTKRPQKQARLWKNDMHGRYLVFPLCVISPLSTFCQPLYSVADACMLLYLWIALLIKMIIFTFFIFRAILRECVCMFWQSISMIFTPFLQNLSVIFYVHKSLPLFSLIWVLDLNLHIQWGNLNFIIVLIKLRNWRKKKYLFFSSYLVLNIHWNRT